MIKPLRKKHLQIWMILAILLPAAIISAYISIPKATTNKLLQPAVGEALPVLIKAVDKINYTASLRMSSDSSQLQLEWKNRAASVYPSSLILHYSLFSPTVSTSVYSYTNIWDAYKIFGCQCDEHYTGSDCSLQNCPVGDDPLTG